MLTTTKGHPYATQELCYFLWQPTPTGWTATAAEVRDALADVLRSEDAHFSALWDGAGSSAQRALGSLERGELVARVPGGQVAIIEPFLREWLLWRSSARPGSS